MYVDENASLFVSDVWGHRLQSLRIFYSACKFVDLLPRIVLNPVRLGLKTHENVTSQAQRK